MPHLASGNLSNVKKFYDVGVLKLSQHGCVSEMVLFLLSDICHHEFCRCRVPAPSGFVDLRCTGTHDQPQEGNACIECSCQQPEQLFVLGHPRLS